LTCNLFFISVHIGVHRSGNPALKTVFPVSKNRIYLPSVLTIASQILTPISEKNSP
jgi:hypothetical protein